MIRVKINGQQHELAASDPSTPLLWVLRDELGLVGTKFGCGIGECGACTVLADGKPVRSCTLTLAAASGVEVTTIEGLSRASQNGDALSDVQQAWIDLDVAQCGYCQAGQIMAATALLTVHANPSDSDIDEAMAGNICRCGTYIRIRNAIHLAAKRGLAAQTAEEQA